MMSTPVSAQGLVPEFMNRIQESSGVEPVQEAEKGGGFQNMLEKHTEKFNSHTPQMPDAQKTTVGQPPKEQAVERKVTE